MAIEMDYLLEYHMNYFNVTFVNKILMNILLLLIIFVILFIYNVVYGSSISEQLFMEEYQPKNDNCAIGFASYYERCFGTCATASGEWFNPDGISVAHKKLPFGTKLLVTNLSNNKKVIVEVNDRGPYISNRDLDLSRGAMRHLNGLNSGVIKVKYCIQ